MNSAMQHPDNVIYGSLAECFITIDGNRYCFMSMTEFSSEWQATIKEVPILGKVGMGHKMAGGKGTWSGTAHYNQSIFRKMAYDYQKTGVMPRFEIQVTNEDPASTIGRQTIILHDCLCESFTLAKFKAGEDTLDESLSGTFESWDMPETFKVQDGMF